MAKMRYAKDCYALNRAGASASMFLPNGYRFVVIVSGAAPRTIPITESATWTIDTPPDLPLGFNEWPILVMVVPMKDAKLFAKMTGEQSREMCRQARHPSINN